MRNRLLSFDEMERVLGRPDREEVSTNRAQLQAAAALLRELLPRALTQRQLECVKLYYYQRMTMEAIGRELGVSKPTVCRHLQRARRRLERSLTTARMARDLLGRERH